MLISTRSTINKIMVIEFTIVGNPKDEKGNAVPKLKMTGRQHWTDKAQAYVAWKKHVTCAFFKGLADNSGMGDVDVKAIREFVDNLAVIKPLITEKQKVRMDIFIRWKDHTHGDPENIFGSIADAIFKQDKYLAGSFDFVEEPTGAGEVDVKITL